MNFQSCQGQNLTVEEIELRAVEKIRSLVRLLQKDDAVSLLIKSCNQIGEAFLFGGLVRDSMFGSSGAFGDLDIFVSGPLDVDFATMISQASRRTNFGGIRLVVGKFDVDIWELPKSYAFRMESGRSISIPSLLDTVCFSTDAVAVSLMDSRIISSSKFRRTLRTRRFEFVKMPLAVEMLQVVRIARLIVKNRVLPNTDVARYFLEGVKEYGRETLVKADADKWKSRKILDQLLVDQACHVCEFVLEDRVGRTDLFDLKGEVSVGPQSSGRDIEETAAS